MRPANDSLTSCARGRCEPETAPIAMLGVTALALLLTNNLGPADAPRRGWCWITAGDLRWRQLGLFYLPLALVFVLNLASYVRVGRALLAKGADKDVGNAQGRAAREVAQAHKRYAVTRLFSPTLSDGEFDEAEVGCGSVLIDITLPDLQRW